MYDLLVALKNIISRKVVNIQTLRQPISAGDTTIYVRSAKRFDPRSDIVIYRDGEGEAEKKTIQTVVDWQTLELTTPISDNYDTSSGRVQNLFEGVNWVRAVYIGDPPVIPRYPAITIYGRTRESEWLTLDSTKETFDVDISVYIEASMYEKGYEYVLKLTKSIETTLFHNFYPLVSPHCETQLTEDVSDTDIIIRVDEDNLNRQFLWFFVENDRYTRVARPCQYRENGVIELVMSMGVPFSAGDDVIFPGRHFYDTRARSTVYGSVVKDSLLWGSRISYFATEEVLRMNIFYEAINRP